MRVLFTLFSLLVAPIIFGNNNTSNESAPQHGIIIGKVISAESKKAIEYATIFIDKDSKSGVYSNQDGSFRVKIPFGKHKVVATCIGYENLEQEVNVTSHKPIEVIFSLKESSENIEAVVVKAEGNSAKLNKTAFNVQAITIDNHVRTLSNITDVLAKANGVRIRESGGVGSDTKISLSGFSGNHVKIFIDGILLSGNNSFSLSNIPANFAERIEVYNGVAPIEFGSDALGGVINIVTKNQNREGWELDASYTYGSFNTHRSNVAFTHQLGNGLQYKINAYQNYSDNNYEIDNTVTIYQGNVSYTPTDIYTVERFHDTYHNEAVIAEVGVRGKSWADALTLSLNGSQFYREVQTGTKQDVVYGGRHREGYSVIPTIKYSKRDLFSAKGLSLNASANYNYGVTTVVDTTVFAYNWFGDTQYKGSARSSIFTQSKNQNWGATASTTYKPVDAHTLSFSYTINSSARVTRDVIAGTNYADPLYTIKSITGASYMYKVKEIFDAQLFSKYYAQSNEGKTYSDSGVGSNHNSKDGYFGYGAAATAHFLKGFQVKASYELAYRLATTTELFGDSDLEIGSIDLKPEKSNNYNASISYKKDINKHSISLEYGIIYRNTEDYIKRVVSSDGESASYTNHGKVETKGWNTSVNYSLGRLLSLGGSFNILNARDAEQTNADNANASLTYGQRLPNEPYMYANGDGTINFYDIFKSDDHLYCVYDLFYQHQFPLYWEAFADPSTKSYVPTQTSHSITLHYSIKRNKYNISLECRNITDAKLYDNYSLQKAGRAFYLKFRLSLKNINQ